MPSSLIHHYITPGKVRSGFEIKYYYYYHLMHVPWCAANERRLLTADSTHFRAPVNHRDTCPEIPAIELNSEMHVLRPYPNVNCILTATMENRFGNDWNGGLDKSVNAYATGHFELVCWQSGVCTKRIHNSTIADCRKIAIKFDCESQINGKR